MATSGPVLKDDPETGRDQWRSPEAASLCYKAAATEVRAMMTKRLFAALVAFLAFTHLAAAQSNADIKRAMGEVAGELQQCSVYFLVITACIGDQRPDLAKTYREMAEKLIGLATASGRAAGVSDDAYTAMNSLETEAMMKAMGGSCTNIAVLLKKYMNFCQRLSQDADPRVKEWIACAKARRPTCDGPTLP